MENLILSSSIRHSRDPTPMQAVEPRNPCSNVDIGFSPNSLGVLFTEKSAIGGPSLP